MKKLISLLLVFLLVLPMGAAKGGESVAEIIHNGIVLPEIPAFTDKPYLMIGYKTSASTYRVWASATPFTYKQSGSHIGLYATGSYARALLSSPFTEWSDINQNYGSANLIYYDTNGIEPVWANHDVQNLIDGSVYFADSTRVFSITGVLLNANEVSIARGGTFQFAATVVGTGDYVDGVVYTLSGNDPNGDTTLSSDGLLTIGANEYSRILTVTAAAKDDTSVTQSATVTVTNHLSKLAVEVKTAVDDYALYGFTVLPDIESVWVDKAAYPFAYATSNAADNGGDQYLFLTPEKPTPSGNGNINYTYYNLVIPANSAIYRRVGDGWALSKITTTAETFMMRSWHSQFHYYDYYYNPFWSSFDIVNHYGTLMCAASAPLHGTVAQFTCSNLLQRDSVYRIVAWVYKVTDGLDVTQPATYTSDLFAGTAHTETVVLPGLDPSTEYAVYGVIWLETDQAASEHKAKTVFKTPGMDFTNTSLYVDSPEITETTADFDIGWKNLPVVAYPNNVQYFISVELDDGTAADNSPVYLFSSDAPVDDVHWFSFTDLEPGTEYTLTAKLLYNKTAAYSGFTDSGVEVTYDFATLGSKRDSFPLGFASGLCGVPITEPGAEYNSWTQGYIVGSALRKAL